MTAELAVVLPALLVVLAACVGALRLGTEQARLDAAAAVASRSAARGDPTGAAVSRGLAAGARSVVLQHRDGLVCARAATRLVVLGLPIPVTGSACALAP
ncbi:MAG: TadE family type IV pilus minor pilin [Amnibacterium sp.]